MAKKEQGAVYNWLTKKYQLIIRNEADFLEKRTISYNYVKVIMLFTFAFTINAVLGYFMIKYVDKLLSNKKDVKELGQEVVKLAEEKEALENKVNQLILQQESLNELILHLEDTTSTKK